MPSFLSRIAAMNRASAIDFCLDMGFSLKRIVNLEETALNSLARLGGLTSNELQSLLTWTGQPLGKVRTSFRGETFVSRAVRNPRIRGCPICLREDAETDTVKPLTRIAMRGDWQLREVSICVKHAHPLVPLWDCRKTTERYDIGARFTEILPDILRGTLEKPLINPSPYDIWLDDRLEAKPDDTWLSDQSLYAATTFCRLLGTELFRLESKAKLNDETRIRLAQKRGFEIVRQGRSAIHCELDKLAATAGGFNDTPKKAFGELYSKLSLDYLNEADFAVYREMLKDCIVAIWPIAAGDVIVGFAHHERKLHSVSSATKEIGIGAKLLEQFLVHARIIAPDDDRPLSRKTFDPRPHADLLCEIPKLVDTTEMKKAIGATHMQLVSLARDKILIPRIDIPTIKSPWWVADGLALVAELQALADDVDPTDKSWEGIQQAQKRTGLRVGIIITAIREGQLQVGCKSGIEGYAGVVVRKTEIDLMAPAKPKMEPIAMMTAAAFARSVGMRTEGWFQSLVLAGHTPATMTPHPKFGGEWTYVSSEDIAAFHKRFLTPATMAIEFGQHRRTLIARLEAAGVSPFAPKGKGYGALFLRADVEAALR